MTLSGKRALVTGGARRLGRAIAIELGRAGVHVALHYNASAAQAEDVVAELETLGVQAFAIGGDLSDPAVAERVADQTLACLGSLDILVNNAGIWGPTPMGSVTPERWDELHHTNLRGPFFLTQRLVPALRATRGAIINIADVGVQKPWRNYTAYLISKGGVSAMTLALARDLAPEIRVNAIAPGSVLLPDDWTPEQHAQSAKNTLLQRVGNADHVAHAVRFLAEAEYVTGVMLPVDGGSHLL